MTLYVIKMKQSHKSISFINQSLHTFQSLIYKCKIFRFEMCVIYSNIRLLTYYIIYIYIYTLYTYNTYQIYQTLSNFAIFQRNPYQKFLVVQNCLKRDLEIYDFLIYKVIAKLKSIFQCCVSTEQHLTKKLSITNAVLKFFPRTVITVLSTKIYFQFLFLM